MLTDRQKGGRAARLGMSAADTEKLDAFAEHLKSQMPADFSSVLVS